MNDGRKQALLVLFMAMAMAMEVLLLSANSSTALAEVGSPMVVAVFAGHTESSNGRGNHRGALSASGTYEYRFNDTVLKLFDEFKNRGIVYKTFPASLNIPFQDRPALAEKSGALILIEIHHDSVQPNIYKELIKAKQGDPLLASYKGFSIHIHPSEKSIGLAKAIDSQMVARKLTWSEYHAEDISGERMKLVEGTKAVYKRENLYILRNSSMPAVIIECGCIANPEEEHLLKKGIHRKRLVEAIHEGILSFLRSRENLDGGDSRANPSEKRSHRSSFHEYKSERACNGIP